MLELMHNEAIESSETVMEIPSKQGAPINAHFPFISTIVNYS